jgi:hypothetical protein
MNPRTGGRAVLELIDGGADAAGGNVRYRAELYVPDATFTSVASVASEGGAVTFAPWSPGEPPAWLVKYATTFLRSVWRERQRDPEVAWPGRINRWREERE